jgi:hypothetical protein
MVDVYKSGLHTVSDHVLEFEWVAGYVRCPIQAWHHHAFQALVTVAQQAC